MLGIPEYQPNFFNDANLFIETYRDRFEKLVGKHIDTFWVMWDEKENEWYPDGPVIIKIGTDQLEFCVYGMDDFSLTVNSINLDEKLDWYGMGDEFPLKWNQNGVQVMTTALNLPIIEINVLTYNFKSTFVETGEPHETGYMMHGIEFVVGHDINEKKFFSIFNGLDQNGLSSEEDQHEDQLERIKITGPNTSHENVEANFKMKSKSQELVREIFEFLKSDFDFQGPVESNIAHERHLIYSNDKFQIDFSDEGNWGFPSITIKNNKKNFAPLPAVWFKPEGLQHKIATDYRKPRNLMWLSKVGQKTLDCSSYPLTQEFIENVDDSFQARGQKIIAIYLLVSAGILKSNMDEIPLLFENPILKKMKKYFNIQ